MEEPQPGRNFGFLVHDVARLMRVAYDRRAKELGLTRSQWWVLTNLFRKQGSTQSELADILEIEKPSLGRLLDRLEAKGWVERRADPADRRAKRIHLTGEVQPLMRELRALAADLRTDALDGIDEPARRRFVDLLLVIKANLLRMNGNGNGSRAGPDERRGRAPARAPMTDQTPPAPEAVSRRRRSLRTLLLGVVPGIAAAVGLYWYATSGRYVSTENAYVKSDIVAISPDVAGHVISVEVAENQLVRKGDLLFRIDPEPFRIALDLAEAKVLAVRHDVEASRAEFHEIEAEIDEAKARVDFSAQQAKRQRELQGRGHAAQASLDQAEMEFATAKQRVAGLGEKLRTVLAKLGGDPASAVELHPDFRASEAERDMAALHLDETEVRAPVDGIVSRMRLQPGEWVEEGEPAFSIIDPASTWIEANLKETQLENLRVGQQVEIEVDAYPHDRWLGEVASISPATGAEFALIPPQNATGNWVKVVQRLPIRIAVHPRDGQPPLRAGMTVTATIDTEREPQLAKLAKDAVAAVRSK